MNKEWYDSIMWDEACLFCHKQHNGTCPNVNCAKIIYDENGNINPEYTLPDEGE
jgi:hypothetical protein